MDQLPLWSEELEPTRRTLGQKVCIGLALVALACGAVGLLLSCCPERRQVPEVPQLPHAPGAVEEPPYVRVRLQSAGKLRAAVDARGTWREADGSATLPAPPGAGPWTIGARRGSLVLNGTPLGVPAAVLHPARGTFRLEGREYRGRLLVRATDDGLRAINVVPPEDYLRSVVASEMYVNWPMEALMAQAVAARTYMLYAVLRDKGYLTPIDLAYKGAGAETGATDLAVKLTEGIVLTYRGDLFCAYFHSTCGGHTVAAEKVFHRDAIPPLSGVPCEWCRASPAYRWRAVFAAGEILDALRDAGVQTIRSIVPTGTEPEGYAREVLINGQKSLDANRFRLALGGAELKSTRFQVEQTGQQFAFSGWGYGHGVGLCQWGARGMAKEGYRWQQILRHYYPGVEIEQIGTD